MAVVKIIDRSQGRNIQVSVYTCLAADTKPTTGLLPDDIIIETDSGSTYKWNGYGWELSKVAGGQAVYGLASNFVVQGAGTYNSTDIMGYRVLVQPSADNTTLSPKSGGADVTAVPAATFIAGDVYPEHLDSITVGTGGSFLLYIP